MDSCSVSFGLCIELVVVTTIREISDWTYALAFCFGPCELWDVTFSARSASSAVEHLLCEKKKKRGKGVGTIVDYLTQAQESCYEWIRCTCKQVCRERCKCFNAACCAQPCAYAALLDWKWAVIVIVFNTVHTIDSFHYLSVWSLKNLFPSRNTVQMNGFNQLCGHSTT